MWNFIDTLLDLTDKEYEPNYSDEKLDGISDSMPIFKKTTLGLTSAYQLVDYSTADVKFISESTDASYLPNSTRD